jgi:hypothetical protein
MNVKSMMVAAVVLAAPAAGASAQGYGYGPPPPPYAYAGGGGAPAQTCDDAGFTIVGAHAGVTVLGFGLNGGARFTAPTDCGGAGYGYGEGQPQFAPRPYAPPAPPMAHAPPPYAQEYGAQGWGGERGWSGEQGWGQQSWGEQGYGYTQPCGCDGPQGW